MALGTTLSWAVAHHLVRRRLDVLAAQGPRSQDRRAAFVAGLVTACLAIPAGLLLDVPADRAAAAAVLFPIGLTLAAVYLLVHRLVGKRWLWTLLFNVT